MRLFCDGRMYEAGEMRSFRTADPATPLIYLTHDGRATFVLSRETDGTLSAHRAGTGEIIALSRRHNFAGLLGAFPSSFAPAQILSEEIEPGCELRPRASGSDSVGFGTPRARVLT
jgi:hypothetical protein